jgi:hypothetical protein
MSNNKDYLNYHPDAVQDVEKAHEMATHSKRSREQAVRFRRVSKTALELASKDGDYSENLDGAFDELDTAKKAGQITEKDFKQKTNDLLTLSQRSSNPDQAIEGLKDNEIFYDGLAESQEQLAAEQFKPTVKK